jgi:hypothetical protein
MKVKIDGKIYELEKDKVENLLTEQVILKIDDVFEDMGAMSSTVKSMLNSLLLMKGFKKEKGSTLIESALIDIVSNLVEELEKGVIDLEKHGIELKEVEEND